MTIAISPALQCALTEIPANRPKGIEPLMVCPSVKGVGEFDRTTVPPFAAFHLCQGFNTSSTTPAQLRPLAPHTPAPGKVAAPVRNSPVTAVS